ncbi:sigma-70 family RNA polymerase sigma factor [Aeromicrobium sp. S22]|nr:sigma-70 family RNA polymerase sigma factor [Aeromicrobium sp. S22]
MVEHDLDRSSALDMTLEELDDGALVELTRQGSTEAYAALYDRYVYSARRLARHLGQRDESDDVVSDAFAQIFGLLQRGKGPDSAFRAYLFTAVRHECGRRAKAVKRVVPTDDDTVIDSAVPFGAGELDSFERNAVRAAYESLPERWRTVLWQLDVEGRKPQELAEALGLKPNSVSALVYRARAGLREAYLQQHVSSTDDSAGQACLFVREHFAAVVRRTASRRDQEKVHAHLETCRACMAVYLDLQEVNGEVSAVATPAVGAGERSATVTPIRRATAVTTAG